MNNKSKAIPENPWYDIDEKTPKKEGMYNVTDGMNICVGNWFYIESIKQWVWNYPDVIEFVMCWQEQEASE